MKQDRLYPALALGGGAAAFLLRLLQNRTGFEPDTGLSVAGNPFALALPVLLAILAAALFALARRLPAEKGDQPQSFQDLFSAADTAVAAVMTAGLLAWLFSGALECVSGLAGGSVLSASGQSGLSTSAKLTALSGVMTLLSGAALFPVLRACRRGRRELASAAAFPAALTLAPVACMVVRLVLVYREDSVNPSLGAYYVELLALVFLILCLYRASSFAFHCGQTRRFALYAAGAVALCLATLADGHSLPALLFYVGGLLLALGLLVMRLAAPARPAGPAAPAEAE